MLLSEFETFFCYECDLDWNGKKERPCVLSLPEGSSLPKHCPVEKDLVPEWEKGA